MTTKSILMSTLSCLGLRNEEVALFWLIFTKCPEGIQPMLDWIIDMMEQQKEELLTYPTLMQKAIFIARSIEGSLPESAEK